MTLLGFGPSTLALIAVASLAAFIVRSLSIGISSALSKAQHRLQAGAAGSAWSVVVPLATGMLRLVKPVGVRDVQLQAGVSYSRSAGVAHNVVNVNDSEFRFVEIELK